LKEGIAVALVTGMTFAETDVINVKAEVDVEVGKEEEETDGCIGKLRDQLQERAECVALN
jgi:hypothetical protein